MAKRPSTKETFKECTPENKTIPEKKRYKMDKGKKIVTP